MFKKLRSYLIVQDVQINFANASERANDDNRLPMSLYFIDRYET